MALTREQRESSITLPGVPEGWELVRFGLPKEGEPFVNNSGVVEFAVRDFEKYQRLIVRKIWTPPEWLKPGWIFIGAAGEWLHQWESPTERLHSGHWAASGVQVRLNDATNFVGPDVAPEDSLIEIAGPE